MEPGSWGSWGSRSWERCSWKCFKSLAAQRYGSPVEFGPGKFYIKSIIAAPVMGMATLSHCGTTRNSSVSLRAQGSGLTFESQCSTDVLDQKLAAADPHPCAGKDAPGNLTGRPADRCGHHLVTGRAHLKHTEGGDFREATYRAIRQGLMSGESVLLEPILSFVIEVEAETCGSVRHPADAGESEPPECRRGAGWRSVAGARRLHGGSSPDPLSPPPAAPDGSAS